MNITYAIGDEVIYKHELPEIHIIENNCGEVYHAGVVTEVESDASGDQVVTVKFDCGLTQVVLGSTLDSAETEV